MKVTKKLVALLLAVVLVFSFAACSGGKSNTEGEAGKTSASNIKIGVILLHNETVGYDKNFIDAIEGAAKALGIDSSQII